MTEVLKKKRGRKPKQTRTIQLDEINELIDTVNSENENIILHLPITINEINNDIFIKSDKTDNIDNIYVENSSNSSDINTTVNQNIFINNNINKIITHTINITNSTKCWWCKYSFDTPAIRMPENYHDNIFYCIGYFCSFNCSKSYNFDMNDSTVNKRDSLINLLYYLTFSEYKNIEASPHWLTLEDFGGPLTISKYREHISLNTKEFLLLCPPLISRQMQIEESYRINKSKDVKNLNNDYIEKKNKYFKQSNSESILEKLLLN